MPTPVTDELTAWLSDEDTVPPEGSQKAVRQATIDLAVWEQLTERLAAGWPPDGWYPSDFYRDDLAARVRLAAAITGLPVAVTRRFRWAIGRVDEKFMTLTRETTTVVVEAYPREIWTHLSLLEELATCGRIATPASRPRK